jgi:peptidyl-prolyl cis-trans isomerase SurA
VSPIVETKFGYHIIQMIDRRGEQVNARHILLQPRIQDEDMYKANKFLDSLSQRINLGGISFAEAALQYSDDKETKYNGGLLINPETNTSRLSPEKMDRLLFFQVDSMKLNEASKPLIMQTSEGQQAYRIVMVKSRTKPHRANLKDDYQKIQEVVQEEKKAKAVNDWIERKRKNIFIQIMNDYDVCKEALQHWSMSESKVK